MITISENKRVVSGVRSTGRIHLGNYHGAIKNWVKLQHEYESFLFIADWHVLTTHYENTETIEESTWKAAEDLLAAGINPGSCTLFIQSQIPEIAELHVLLSMITPIGWLERVPTYKDQKENLKERDLSTYGFLGYPVLQAADILIYKAAYVPVGEDQLAHVELVRELARRFNFLFGKSEGFVETAEAAIVKMGKKNAKLFRNLMKQYQEKGDQEALEKGRALLVNMDNISVGDRDRLYGYLEGCGKIILPEPEALLTESAKMPGLDGRKMSKSYNNTIGLTEENKSIETKIKVMPTDPARVKRSDPGDPEKCPVWEFHKIYSTDEVKDWVMKGCRTAGIGCIECKGEVISKILEELKPIKERAKEYTQNRSLVANIIQEGAEKAREIAKSTILDVREAIGLAYR